MLSMQDKSKKTEQKCQLEFKFESSSAKKKLEQARECKGNQDKTRESKRK